MMNIACKLPVHFFSDRIEICDFNLLVEDEKKQVVNAVTNILSPNVVKALPDDWQAITSIEKAQSWLQLRLDESELLVLTLKATNELIGFLLLSRFDKKQGVSDGIHIGYLLGEQYWGQGYASELLSAFVDFTHQSDNYPRLIAGVETNNIASRKVLEKAGFIISENETSAEGNIFYELQ
ncbi:GNAT family N-acetyltransferase [Colwelliaceae bacterium 6471]